ncbi:Panacea domain-containing protein [Solimonas variicoloris]|uniref:Panacea domain-containing protein n=1 Tax=Solimonas variicoloris TaxID=254408 RepID=UPI00068632C5|nr:type II toxin-antitoxin system antitoxin SocA domain-containing protein [Solimonas variicoloris]
MKKAIDVAKWLINRTHADDEVGAAITHLKVQKLLYYTEAWSQVLRGKPFMQEDFQAWAHGPVVQEVFDVFRDKKWESLPPQQLDVEFDDEERELLEQVYDVYGEISAKKLEAMTHGERPWISARNGLPAEARCNAIISKASIKEFFQDKYKEALADEENSQG